MQHSYFCFHFCGQRDARKLRGIDHIESKDPYNMQEMAMPLDKYINDPVAHDIVHNGATFQVLFCGFHYGVQLVMNYCLVYPVF